ncbi:MAG: beta-galactosidase trimerization domain-containing protein [Clostridiaceae bacterium]|nr:beta-galactosidase trimerization domain-containing protein [Clostridiaceae bacterium]
MKKKRADSYFGLHFDFHASTDSRQVGKSLNTDNLDLLLRTVRPDFVQCDTKGHPGYTSFQSRLGNACDLYRDVLRTWRAETAKYDIPLYSHYSGVWDANAVAHHPDWAAADASGTLSDRITSVFGPYVDELLIPQLLELAGEIGMDGVWIDGDCWACVIDYSRWARDAWTKRTGQPVPKPEDDSAAAYAEFCRQGFRDYVAHYIDAVHARFPDFQMTSNWAYSSHMPEKPTAAVDYLSGDYSPNDSFRSARYEGRFFQHQGKPWDLMAWGFSSIIRDGKVLTHVLKTPRQLMQEASEVLALGGGFQCYNIQHDGGFHPEIIPSMKALAEFVRARKTFCHNAAPVPQVGVVLSEKAFYADNSRPFTPPTAYTADLRGLVHLLLDARHSVEFLPTYYALSCELSAYPVLVVPELDRIEPELRKKLEAYVANGGSLLLTGAHTAEVFGMPAAPAQERAVTFSSGGHTARLWTQAASDSAAVTVISRGKGKLAVCPVSLGAYMDQRSDVLCDFLDGVLRELYTPVVTLQHSRNVEMALTRKDGALMVNLINTSGPHADVGVKQFDEIPPVYGLTVEVRLDAAPKAVWLEPEHLPASWRWSGNAAQIVVNELDIHTVIAIEV